MNKLLIAACIMAVSCIQACSGNEPDHDSSLMNAVPATTSTTVVDSREMAKADSHLLPVGSQPAINPLPQQIVNNLSTAPGMNPPHGQPGHRCDIAVGAPLNSAPAKPASPTVTTTASPAVVQQQASKVITPAGMNPPHGEPNHRCDIAVGAPLNSAPAKPATQAINPVPVELPDNVPVKKDSGS